MEVVSRLEYFENIYGEMTRSLNIKNSKGGD